MRITTLLALASLGTLGSVALAQPKLVITYVTSDLSANGNNSTGWIYDGALRQNAGFKFTRGIGFTRIPATAPSSGSAILCSSDASILATALNNTSNWGDLNCFTGYNANGTPRFAQNPCSMPSIAHRFTAAGGWVNTGSLPRYADPATGRMVGGTRCDYTINTPYDMSANGRYIVGGAYSTTATNSVGNPATGMCGDYYAFIYDSQTGVLQNLATTSRTTVGTHVSGDGSVVTGYDLNASTSSRRLAVWTNGVETILDSGTFRDAPVNGPGTIIAAGASPSYCLGQFGVESMCLVVWNRAGNTWVPQNLGTAADWVDDTGSPNQNNALVVRGISDDGGTIVGDAYYGGDNGQLNGVMRPFIWRAGLNGGVATDLNNYLATLDPSGAKLAGTFIQTIYSLGADGNTLLVSGPDLRTTCTAPSQTLYTTFAGILSLDGAAVGNDPATIAINPVDVAERYEWAGNGAVFNVIAGGTWPLNYQWQREDPNSPNTWTDLTNSCSGLPNMTFPHDASWEFEGVNSMQLRVNVVNAGGGHEGRYRCVVSNAYGSVTSNPATLTWYGSSVNPLTPAPATGCANSPASFSVGAIPGVEYRWEICTNTNTDTWAILTDGTNTLPMGTITVSGTRTETMTVNPGTLPATSTYLFRCHLAWSIGTLDSNPGELTIGSPCGLADVGAQGGVPAPCGDGVLDNNDFIVFIDYFFESNSLADVGMQGGVPGSDGQWDNNDFIVFIDYFFGGCN